MLEEFFKLAPRLCENEEKAAEIIIRELEKRNIKFEIQEFKATHPKFLDWKLFDKKGKEIKCLPSGLKSGELKEFKIINSLEVDEIEEPNVNYNPKCKDISVPNVYNTTALAINYKDKNKPFEGYLGVERYKFISKNIIAGNLKDPEKIILTHYDSLWGGTIDNAFSVFILLNLPKEFYERFMMVFSGTEEICYEEPKWSLGYVEFQKEFEDLFLEKKVIIVDSVGYTETKVYDSSSEEMKEAIYLIFDKKDIFLIASDIEKLMEIYHSPADSLDKIKNKKTRNDVEILLLQL